MTTNQSASCEYEKQHFGAKHIDINTLLDIDY